MIRRIEKRSSPRQLGPGERLIDGEVYYSAAWLDDPLLYLAVERGFEAEDQLRCKFAPDDPKEAA
jgi:hypothetical protein